VARPEWSRVVSRERPSRARGGVDGGGRSTQRRRGHPRCVQCVEGTPPPPGSGDFGADRGADRGGGVPPVKSKSGYLTASSTVSKSWKTLVRPVTSNTLRILGWVQTR